MNKTHSGTVGLGSKKHEDLMYRTTLRNRALSTVKVTKVKKVFYMIFANRCKRRCASWAYALPTTRKRRKRTKKVSSTSINSISNTINTTLIYNSSLSRTARTASIMIFQAIRVISLPRRKIKNSWKWKRRVLAVPTRASLLKARIQWTRKWVPPFPAGLQAG